MPRTIPLKHFVLKHSLVKTKHLRSLVQGFERLETLGFRKVFNATHKSTSLEFFGYVQAFTPIF
jgi:hypothetical protein